MITFYFKHLQDITDHDESTQLAVNRFLSEHGWSRVSNTPGALMMWGRDHEGRTLVADEATALSIENALEVVARAAAQHSCDDCNWFGDLDCPSGEVARCPTCDSVEIHDDRAHRAANVDDGDQR